MTATPVLGRVTCALLVAIVAMQSVSANTPTRFEAALEDLDRTYARGTVGTWITNTSRLEAVPAEGAPPGVVFRADEAVLTIVERRYYAIDPDGANVTVGDALGNRFRSGGTPAKKTFFGDHVSIDLVRPRPNSTFLLASQGTVDVRLGIASCELKPLEPQTQTVGRPLALSEVFPEQRRADEGLGLPDAPAFGTATCDARLLSLNGSHMLRVWDADVVISFRDASDGTWRNMSVRTGREYHGNSLRPAMAGFTERYVSVRANHPNASFGLGGPDGSLRVTASTPVFSVAGELEIPAARGHVAWGKVNSAGQTPSMRPSGVFLVRLDQPGAFRIDGVTQNAAALANPQAPVGASLEVAAYLVATLAGLWILRPLVAAAFTRIVKHRLLNHPRRQAIFDLISANPGISITELLQELKLSRGVAAHHVQFLDRQGLIVLRRFGRRTALFVTGQLSQDEQEQTRLLRNPLYKRIKETVERNPGIRQVDVAAKLGLSQPYVSTIMRRLNKHRSPGRQT